MGQNGKSLVEDNIDNFVKYYIECTQVINLGTDKLVYFRPWLNLMPKILKFGNPKHQNSDNFRNTKILKSQPISKIIPKISNH